MTTTTATTAATAAAEAAATTTTAAATTTMARSHSNLAKHFLYHTQKYRAVYVNMCAHTNTHRHTEGRLRKNAQLHSKTTRQGSTE